MWRHLNTKTYDFEFHCIYKRKKNIFQKSRFPFERIKSYRVGTTRWFIRLSFFLFFAGWTIPSSVQMLFGASVVTLVYIFGLWLYTYVCHICLTYQHIPGICSAPICRFFHQLTQRWVFPLYPLQPDRSHDQSIWAATPDTCACWHSHCGEMTQE